MSGKLDGKIAIVTGAARGLGRAIAQLYAAEGATVYALDVLEDELKGLAELPGDIRSRKLDLTDAESIEPTLKAIEAETGRIDVLVNNAGIIFSSRSKP